MKRPPAVVVHGLDQARAVLGRGLDVTLISGRGAGWYAGAPWWIAMIQAAREACGRHFADVLDCAEGPGAALAALRVGQRLIVLDGGCPAFARVAAIARGLSAEAWPTRPPCLDLDEPGAERRLSAWLAADGDTVAGLR